MIIQIMVHTEYLKSDYISRFIKNDVVASKFIYNIVLMLVFDFY